MQQKMSIFKVRNSVCRGPKIFQGCEMFKLNFDDFLMKDRGAMRQKMSIFKGGNSVCRDAKISS